MHFDSWVMMVALTRALPDCTVREIVEASGFLWDEYRDASSRFERELAECVRNGEWAQPQRFAQRLAEVQKELSDGTPTLEQLRAASAASRPVASEDPDETAMLPFHVRRQDLPFGLAGAHRASAMVVAPGPVRPRTSGLSPDETQLAPMATPGGASLPFRPSNPEDETLEMPRRSGQR